MKLKGILVIVFMAITLTGFSQRWKLKRYEVLFGVGSTNIYGDIGGTADADNMFGLKDIRINETRYSLYAGARYKLKKDLALKFNLIYGKGIGDDKDSRNAEYRGYSFTTSIIEPSFQLEYSFLSEERKISTSKLYSRRGMVNNFTTFSAYGFAGLGGVLFNPKLDLHGKTAASAETIDGYGKFSVVIPIGLGVKYAIDKNWSLGFEFGRRFALSDYLDGISTKYSKANDTYYFGVFQAIYKLNTNREGIPEFLVRRARPGRNR
jgi:opacity protein-like surface antigen